jgi:Family of unknown function (DUF5403)
MSDHNIDWFHPERGGRGPESSTGAVVSHLPGVKAELHKAATKMGREASMGLAAHRKTGAAHVEVEHHDLDWYVRLVDRDPGGKGRAGKNKGDRSAMSIEFGWTQTHAFGRRLGEPIQHDGLHILGHVMQRAIARHGGR